MMTLEKKKVEQLVAELTKYNEEYYRDGKPSVSDEEYDKKRIILDAMVSSNPVFTELAKPILHKVGSPSLQKGFAKANHVKEMLSLDSVYDANGFQNWVKYCNNIVNITNSDLIVQPKLDGLSIELIYKSGKFTQAITRGDGKVGEDVTDNILATKEVPLEVRAFKDTETVAVLGEVIIHKTDFDTYLKDTFKNPRNAAVGSLKQLDSSVIPSRYLRVYVYDAVTTKPDGYNYNSIATKYLSGIMQILDNNRFRIVPFSLSSQVKEIPAIFKNMTIWRNTYDVEMDGIVIKCDNKSIQDSLGCKPHVPVWAIAWKFNSMTGVSVVKDIEWSISKSGTLTPVAKVEPVDIGGVTISNVNLHNYKFATTTLDLKVGDTVDIRRAGDVIPEIVSVNKTMRMKNKVEIIKPPTNCPECGSHTTYKGVDLICPNPQGICTEQTVFKLSHLAAREALNIDGLSTQTLRTLVKYHGVKTPLELYKFDFDTLRLSVGFGDTKVDNLKKSLKDSLEADKASFMYSLAIPEVGKSTAEKIINALEKNNSNSEFYELSDYQIRNLGIKGIGNSVANSIDTWNKEQNKDDIIELMDLFTFHSKSKPKVQATNTNNPLNNRAVVFTGKLDNMGLTRSQARIKVEKLGGWEASGLGSADILIVGSKPGSKLTKANGMSGITIMREDEFQKIVVQNGV